MSIFSAGVEKEEMSKDFMVFFKDGVNLLEVSLL